MKRTEFISWCNYQRVLLAVHWLSEKDGMRCYATFGEIATETRLSVPTVRKHVARLRHVGIGMRAQVADRPHRRPLVLLDHPEASEYLEHNAHYWGPLSVQCELNRKRDRAAAKSKVRAKGSQKTGIKKK